MKCISCNFEQYGNYCPNCGEKKGIKKITFTSIIEDAFISITNMDRGFLYNFKTLVLNPQKITGDYIFGKRKGILNPVSYLIFSVTIYLIVLTIFKAPKNVVEANTIGNPELKKVAVEVGTFIRINLKYFWILSIIPLGLSLKLIHTKYNYLEHLAISSFIIGQATLIGVVSYVIFRFPLIFDPIVYLVIFWLIYKIFINNNDRVGSILLSVTTLLLFLFQLIIIMGTIGVIKYFL